VVEDAKAHHQAAGEFMIVNDALLNLAWMSSLFAESGTAN